MAAVDRWSAISLNTHGVDTDPAVNPSADRDREQEVDFPPVGVSRGARTTLDAIRPTDKDLPGMTSFTSVTQLAGAGVRHFNEPDFGCGLSSVLIHCERIRGRVTPGSKAMQKGPKAVRVFVCLEDAERDDVRLELMTCRLQCMY